MRLWWLRGASIVLVEATPPSCAYVARSYICAGQMVGPKCPSRNRYHHLLSLFARPCLADSGKHTDLSQH
jgi:hypothetical protein